MVDVSGSMQDEDCVPYHSAIGLGIRIAEKSKFGKRVLTFCSSPSWVNIDDDIAPDFISKVEKISNCEWGQSTNFRKALELILLTAINNNISPEDMSDMSLVILSDMQIDYAADGANVSVTRTVYKNDKVYFSDTVNTYFRPWQAIFEYGPGTEGIPESD